MWESSGLPYLCQQLVLLESPRSDKAVGVKWHLCHFNLYFSDYKQGWISFPMFILVICFLFCKMPNHTFCSFFHLSVLFILLTHRGPCTFWTLTFASCLENVRALPLARSHSLFHQILLLSQVTKRWSVPELSHLHFIDLIQSHGHDTILHAHDSQLYVTVLNLLQTQHIHPTAC